jgi:hypothetical protein
MNSHSVILAVPFTLITSFAQAEKIDVDCPSIFSPLVESEPLLKTELLDLQQTCQQESKHLARYWSCVETRQNQGEPTFERLILNAQTCNDISLANR